ncbi:S1C family serine protease [Rubellimicrobium arenae]|uniref:S1C family serine protease n=1 Tax=Rubellimicrobium arenae TaxID=2817372 RepID=UPI001B3129D8|nr:serine protease [Rubellimicrobium arenae]
MTLCRFASHKVQVLSRPMLLSVSVLAATWALPVLAQGYLDFGANASRWAYDGECDDPRFAGPGAADVLVQEDLMADAADCEAAFRMGSVWLQTGGAPSKMPSAPQPVAPRPGVIDFGFNTSRWAYDGECDDPRFAGPGAADVLVPEDYMADAADCEAAFRMGSVWLQEGVPGPIGMPIAPKLPPSGPGMTPQGPEAEPPPQEPAEPPVVSMDWPAWAPATTDRNEAESAIAMEPQEVFAATEGSIYLLLAAATPEELAAGEGSLGSAVAISKHLALTNCHVVEGAPSMTLVDETSDEEIAVELLSADPETDRCILRTDAWLRPIKAIRPADSLTVGERVYSIGNPSGLSKTFAEGLISGVREDGGITLVQTSAPISPGSSGGALVDASGALVGITTFLLRDTQNLNFAISASAFWE